MKLEAVTEVVVKRAKIQVRTGKPSVMHTKHECTRSQAKESKENETTRESPHLLAPSSGYKN